MDAGKLRHRVTIERFMQGAQDPNTGDIINQWQVLRTVWASFEPVSGREFIAAQAGQSEVTARIVVRFTDVTTKDRIAMDGCLYNIHAVLPDPKSNKHYLTLMVSQGVNNG